MYLVIFLIKDKLLFIIYLLTSLRITLFVQLLSTNNDENTYKHTSIR